MDSSYGPMAPPSMNSMYTSGGTASIEAVVSELSCNYQRPSSPLTIAFCIIYIPEFQVVRRVVKIMSGFGLSINGQHVYCGDFIFSGHTMILILAYLIITECKYIQSLLFQSLKSRLFLITHFAIPTSVVGNRI